VEPTHDGRDQDCGGSRRRPDHKVEHYEIASYGSVGTLAGALGEKEVAKLLGQTLEEEKQAGAGVERKWCWG
jgi:ferritin-like metal-binding protein YciE